MTDRTIPFDFFRKKADLPELSARGLAVLEALESYWRSLPCENGVPLRRAIAARDLGDALPHAFIAERVAPGLARIRVAGRAISEIVGSEARGMPLSCLIAPDARADFSSRLELAFSRPAVLGIPLVSPARRGRPALRGKMLILPLRNEDGAIDRLIGAVVLAGELGNVPRRCALDDTAPWRCDQVLSEDSRIGLVSQPGDEKIFTDENLPLAGGAAKPATPDEPGTKRPGRNLRALLDAQHRTDRKTGQADTEKGLKKGHLRLIVDNDRKR